MHERPPTNKEQNPDQYLKNVEDRFVFDSTNGIYKPKAYAAKAERRDTGQQGHEWSRFLITTIISVLTLLAVAFYAYYAKLQWCEMKNAADAANKSAIAAQQANTTTREALVSVQRAFVFLDHIQTVVSQGSVDVGFIWANSGTTPTKTLTMHVSGGEMPHGLPEHFNFPDKWTVGTPQIATPTVIGPKGTTEIHLNPQIPPEVMDRISPSDHLYIWGWSKYRDVFDKTPLHITEFCSEVIKVSGTPPIRFNTCNQHNCYDEQCSDYQKKIAEP